MNEELKTAKVYDAMKPTSFRSPADGEEQFPLKMCEASLKHDFPKAMTNVDGDCKTQSISPTTSDQGTPPYCRWAQSLSNLLEDHEGTELFQQFLKQEHHDTQSLDFWFACEGVKHVDNENTLTTLIKVINRNYVSCLPNIDVETKREIAKRISTNSGLDTTIFDKAQQEIETDIMRTTYPNFLRSDIYIQYMQNDSVCRTPENEVKTVAPTTGSLSQNETLPKTLPNVRSSHEDLEMLPTVFEDTVLQLRHNNNNNSSTNNNSRNMKSIFNWTKFNDMKGKPKPESQAGHYLKSNTPGYNTCYTKYAAYLPPSARDSELQSLSSDLQTDDSMSVISSSTCDTDYKVKYCPPKCHRPSRSKQCPLVNKDALPQCAFVALPDRMTEKKTCPPSEFAAILTSKLNEVIAERRLKEQLNAIHDQPVPNTESSDERPQEILDKHVLRVFHDPSHQTPSPSPGCLTPSAPLPDNFSSRRRDPAHQSNNNFNSAYPSCRESKHRRDYSHDRETGFAEDYAILHSTAMFNDHGGNAESSYEHSLGRSPKDLSRRSRKLSAVDSGSSCFDSGISGVDASSCHTGSQDRLSLDSKKYSSYGTDSERDFYRNKSPASASPLFDESSRKAVFSNNRALEVGSAPWPVSITSSCGSVVETAYYLGIYGNQQQHHDAHSQRYSDYIESRRQMEIVKQKLKPLANARDKPTYDTSRTKSLSKSYELPDEDNFHRKSSRKSYPSATSTSASTSSEVTSVAYCYGRGSVPFLCKLQGKNISLKQFKSLLSKKGNFKYFFKTATEDLGVVFEEITDDSVVLPLWEGKIFCHVEQME